MLPRMSESPRSRWRAFFGRYLISLVVATSLVVAGVALVNRGIDERVQKIPRVKLVLATPPPQGANYLIIGSDTRKFAGESGDVQGFGDPTNDPSVQGQRSDTLMVAHVEPGSQRTVVVSFPRDLWVTIPGHEGMYKINAAYDFGGPQLVIDTLKANFDIDINHYLEVDFKSFQAIVEAIGYVKVYFPYPARDQETGVNALAAGCFPLDGQAALAYVRSRSLEYYIDGQWVYDGQDAPDLHRIQRQQAFIRKLTGLAIEKSLGDPLLAVDIADPRVALSAGRHPAQPCRRQRADPRLPHGQRQRPEHVAVRDRARGRGDRARRPVDPHLGDGWEQTVAQLRTFGDNTPPPPIVAPQQVTVKVVDGSGKDLAIGTARALRDQRFHASVAKTTPAGATTSDAGVTTTVAPVTTTEIHYAPDQVEEAKALLNYVPDAKLVPDPAATGSVLLVLGTSFPGTITVPPTTTTLPGTPTIAPTTAPPTTTTTIPAVQNCN